MLKNSENGAPYLIADSLKESHIPGGKRDYEKKHLAPNFDYKSKFRSLIFFTELQSMF
jgi:hypothetical protein